MNGQKRNKRSQYLFDLALKGKKEDELRKIAYSWGFKRRTVESYLEQVKKRLILEQRQIMI